MAPQSQKPLRKQQNLKDNSIITPLNSFSSLFPSVSNPVGIGLRAPYYQEILDSKPDLGWLEVHPENYFGGGRHLKYLEDLRALYPLSFHAVGLSLGSTDLPDENHLRQIKSLINRFQPFQFSDHVSWSASGNAHLNDLLPLPYTNESLDTVCRNVTFVQEFLGQNIVVENPSTYIAFKDNDMSEPEFMNEIAARTGCGILLDVNNIYVQSHNHGLDAKSYIDDLQKAHVREIHLAGHTARGELLVDTHSKPVCDAVWELFTYAVQKTGNAPTLIEWDQDFPPLSILVEQAQCARNIISTGICDVAA